MEYMKTITPTCECCGIVFTTKLRPDRVIRYCSRKCFAEHGLPVARAKGHKTLEKRFGHKLRTPEEMPKELECPGCHKMFPCIPGYPLVYCSMQCYQDWRERTRAVPRTPQGRRRPGQTFRWQRKHAREHYNNKCNRCGYDKIPEILQVHHRDRDSRNHDISNLELLCPNCHEGDRFVTKTGRYGLHSRKKRTDGLSYHDVGIISDKCYKERVDAAQAKDAIPK